MKNMFKKWARVAAAALGFTAGAAAISDGAEAAQFDTSKGTVTFDRGDNPETVAAALKKKFGIEISGIKLAETNYNGKPTVKNIRNFARNIGVGDEWKVPGLKGAAEKGAPVSTDETDYARGPATSVKPVVSAAPVQPARAAPKDVDATASVETGSKREIVYFQSATGPQESPIRRGVKLPTEVFTPFERADAAANIVTVQHWAENRAAIASTPAKETLSSQLAEPAPKIDAPAMATIDVKSPAAQPPVAAAAAGPATQVAEAPAAPTSTMADEGKERLRKAMLAQRAAVEAAAAAQTAEASATPASVIPDEAKERLRSALLAQRAAAEAAQARRSDATASTEAPQQKPAEVKADAAPANERKFNTIDRSGVERLLDAAPLGPSTRLVANLEAPSDRFVPVPRKDEPVKVADRIAPVVIGTGSAADVRPEPKPELQTPPLRAIQAEAAKAEPAPLKAPSVEAVRSEPAKADAPKVETPRAEAPKAEPAKAETPKTDAPKVEAPKAEAPKAEAPKAEAPKAATPKADAAKDREIAEKPAKLQHAIVSGEVLNGIAKDTGFSCRAMAKKNHIHNWNKIFAGQVLVLDGLKKVTKPDDCGKLPSKIKSHVPKRHMV